MMRHVGGIEHVQVKNFRERLRHTSDSRGIIYIWLSSRLYISLVGLIASTGLIKEFGFWNGFISSWRYFDTLCYENIVEFGYLGSDFCTDNTAFFPGLPTLMWFGEILGLNTTVTGVMASLISSLLAGIALGKIANHMGINPQITVAVWYLAPMAVFLFAPYAESIFAAFSFWAWYLGLKGNWIAAGLLGGFAAFTRSNGIFLGIALIVLFLVSKKRDWRMAPFLLLPFVAVGIYFAYLYTLTGSWTYWYEAQAQGWDRSFTNPINSTLNTIQMAIDAPENGLTVSRLLSELANTFIVLGIGVILLIKKWWAEATYVFITMASLITGEFFQSTMRATLILFPVWLYVGLLATKSRPFRFGYFIIAVPFLTLIITRYVDGQWIS